MAVQQNTYFNKLTSLPNVGAYDGLVTTQQDGVGMLLCPNVVLPNTFSNNNIGSSLLACPWITNAGTNALLYNGNLSKIKLVLGKSDQTSTYHVFKTNAKVTIVFNDASAIYGIGNVYLPISNGADVTWIVPNVTALQTSSVKNPKVCFCGANNYDSIDGRIFRVILPQVEKVGAPSENSLNLNQFSIDTLETGYPRFYIYLPKLKYSIGLFLAENRNSSFSKTLYFRKEELMYFFQNVNPTPAEAGAVIRVAVDRSLYDINTGTWLDTDLDEAAARLETPVSDGANAWILEII